MSQQMGDAPREDLMTAYSWPTGTTVRLMTVPWDSQYTRTIAWESTDARDRWLAEHSQGTVGYVSEHFAYLRMGEPITIPLPFSAAYAYNYCIVTNPAQPVSNEGKQRTYCYFINNVTYVSPAACQVDLQLDVWCTYCDSWSMGSAYVERGHYAVSNGDACKTPDEIATLARYGALCGEDEGLDVGGDTIVEGLYVKSLTENSTHPWLYLVMSSIDLTADPGTVDDPHIKTPDQGPGDNLMSGCALYPLDIDNFRKLLAGIKDYPWIAQGIQSISVFPGYFTHNYTKNTHVRLIGNADSWIGPQTIYPEQEIFLNQYKNDDEIYIDPLDNNLSDYLIKSVPEWLQHYGKVYTYPYAVIDMSLGTEQHVMLKPELIQDNCIRLSWISMLTPPYDKVVIYPKRYGFGTSGKARQQRTRVSIKSITPNAAGANLSSHAYDGSDGLSSALVLDNFPRLSVVNNSYMVNLAATAHTRAYQYDSAGWALNKGKAANALALSNAKDAVSTGQANLGISQGVARLGQTTGQASFALGQQHAQMASQMGLINGAVGTGLGVVGNLAGGNVGGAIGAGLQGAVSTGTQYMLSQDQISTQAQQQALNYGLQSAQIAAQGQMGANQLGMQGRVANRNYTYAQYATQGDYANAIAGINATYQDMALTPPSTLGQMGGEALMINWGLLSIITKIRRPRRAALANVGRFWCRYGYRMDISLHWDKPLTCGDMNVMTLWSYWKCLDVELARADMDEHARNVLRGILEHGTMCYGAPDSIATTDVRKNQPLTRVGALYEPTA